MPNWRRGYIVTVMPESDKTIDLDRRLSVLEERMNTITESYDRGWKHLEAKMGEDTAKRDSEMARRNTANTRWLIGVIIAASAIIIAVLLSTS
ncbi:MAG: hypothetical protein OXH65_03105 [Paracoccaceae bacterium]|nr:hypothetical protein [Paracoccaceae bacterium]